ncbi:MAG: hypothetical protein ACOX8T_10675 [Bacillota bacterium]|jgi:hypothetical protein|nr:hypothetical protein [Lentisphaerota bacterium]
MVLLTLTRPRLVRGNFRSWMRMMNQEGSPSERVVAQSLVDKAPRFLRDAQGNNVWAKFILENVDAERRTHAA